MSNGQGAAAGGVAHKSRHVPNGFARREWTIVFYMPNLPSLLEKKTWRKTWGVKLQKAMEKCKKTRNGNKLKSLEKLTNSLVRTLQKDAAMFGFRFHVCCSMSRPHPQGALKSS